ncbi:eCIS core domain-containing protein [Stutzerimonas zhaodongensis]|uniref:eCIS core domain-containing protein n=1 Tax=Stutzerimonas TaxID=2901164 RepID=UPI00388EDF38
MSAAFACVLGSSIFSSQAQTACAPGQQPLCLGGCACVPVSPQHYEPLHEQVQWLAAAGLETWIRQSHAQLMLQDTHPIPLHIRSQLEPYFDLAVLETARYRVGDDNVLTAANTLLRNPDIAAVTLIDIIVFRNEADAQDNVALWAHELKHVEQYLQWGVGEFARRYTRDFRSVEQPGYAMELQIEREQALRLVD